MVSNFTTAVYTFKNNLQHFPRSVYTTKRVRVHRSYTYNVLYGNLMLDSNGIVRKIGSFILVTVENQ